MPNILDKICQSHFSQQSVDWFVFRPRMLDNKQYETKYFMITLAGDCHNLQNNFPFMYLPTYIHATYYKHIWTLI